ncbi:hypothetical protein V1638_16915 [Pseudarthrobacter sp. J64]|uniref:hypothetical protein n=1 Tax=Pseudarthrobacter sp. J64 TaxID=3116485 RepID=UPI002E823575|nr:hypothetical protein [Pseudarthrobacter sp. J64]MEE2571056.1 hypothetical protein [Pseudarthrobacter sp. J64]
MTFETSSAQEANRSLDVDQAAARAGLSVASFRALMSKINGTPEDLRTPPKAGERARQYDPDKLDEWIRAGRPISDFRAQAGEGPSVHIPATATWAGNRWNITTDAPHVSASAPDLKTATRTATEDVNGQLFLPMDGH